MTNSVDKQQLVAALDIVIEGLDGLQDALQALYSASGDGYVMGANRGAAGVLTRLREALTEGFYDESEEFVVIFDEEDCEDTLPDAGQQDEDIGGGTAILDPNTSDEEREELTKFYAGLGLKVQ